MPERATSNPTQRLTHRLPKERRVKRRSAFLRAQNAAPKVHTPRFVITAALNRTRASRIGITVTKKVGGAVQRNRIKRVVREVYRTHLELFPEGYDFVLIAKRAATNVTYASLFDEIRAVHGKLVRAFPASGH